jgi:hypothetical protein
MFSTLVFESGREPLRLQDVPAGVISWVQDMGGWAAFFLLLWLLLGYTRTSAVDRARIPRWLYGGMLVLILAAAAAYVPLLFVWGRYWVTNIVYSMRGIPPLPPRPPSRLEFWCLTLGGLFAILAVCLPILRNVPALRGRRVWALTRHSFKEALRRRVLYALSALLLVFLFATWFVPHKPEDQVRSYVQVVFFPMSMLLLFTALLLAAFSIPTDIRQQTIHTIVTKPVERFEVVLGRFSGFAGLMTVVLFVMTAVSLLYVLRGVDPLAAAESLKAREPVYGDLHFEDTEGGRGERGVSVGREWNYRSYISRGSRGVPPLFAVWEFDQLPAGLAGRPNVRCEFSLDIFRTTKGFENRGITCSFAFKSAGYEQLRKEAAAARQRDPREEYHAERDRLIAAGRPVAEVDNELAGKYGYFEVPAFEVVDYHTQFIDIPGKLVDNAQEALARQSTPAPGARPVPALSIGVACLSQAQYVGMAKYDLYLRADDPEAGADTMRFAGNFFKGSLGLWMRIALLTGLAVALSTQLSGVISFVVALVFFGCGLFRDFIQELAVGAAPEGGPFQSLIRIARREVAGGGFSDTSALGRAAVASDSAVRWGLRRLLDWIPDLDRLTFTSYVKEGFNVPALQILLGAGMLLGYLLPWMVAAYYFMRWREVASSQ